jgi:hypothetical protein
LEWDDEISFNAYYCILIFSWELILVINQEKIRAFDIKDFWRVRSWKSVEFDRKLFTQVNMFVRHWHVCRIYYIYIYICLFVCLTYCAVRRKHTLDLAKYSKVDNVQKSHQVSKGIQIVKDTWSLVRRFVVFGSYSVCL